MQRILGLRFGAEGGAQRSGYEGVHTPRAVAARLACIRRRRHS